MRQACLPGSFRNSSLSIASDRVAVTTTPVPTAKPNKVVGIGASAGGLEAFSRLFAALPAHTGLAFVLVPHLSPTHPSELTQLMARVASFPVAQASDGDKDRRIRQMLSTRAGSGS